MRKSQPPFLFFIMLIVFGVWKFDRTPKPNNEPTKSAVQNQEILTADDQNFAKTNRTLPTLSTQEYDVSLAEDKYGKNATAPVDYYMLVLSWSPSFCDEQAEKFGNNLPRSAQSQCGIKKQFGWVVHGLWPQNARAKTIADHPRFCQGDLPPLPQSLFNQYLSMSPGEKLLQGEWEKHGACAFSDAKSYFDKMQNLYKNLNLPMNNPNKKELLRWMKNNNPNLRNVFLGVNRSSIYICYDLDFKPMNCPR